MLVAEPVLGARETDDHEGPTSMSVPTASDTPGDALRELHEDYAWEVNAAVGRDEDRVVARLSREFTDRALRLISNG